MPACAFCELSPDRIIWSSELVVAVRDLFPVSPGHTLVITRRHTSTYFEASAMEQAEIWRAVEASKDALDSEYSPQGYNVGFNARKAAGQTVMHLHVHVIPRFDGDVDDPRGGVRGVIPRKQKYQVDSAPAMLMADSADTPSRTHSPFAELPEFIGGENDAFAPPLRRALQLADKADIVAAFVQPAGLAVIEDDLRDALARGARVRLLTGDYLNATSPDALRSMLSLRTEYLDNFVPYFFVGGGTTSFHAKAYIFTRGCDGVAYVGSSNLTRTALTQGIEWNLRSISSVHGEQFAAVKSRFDQLLRSPQVSLLSRELVDLYSERAKIPEGPDPRIPPPSPHELQREALEALRSLREEGSRAGLVVMATGLGKTYLSALDCRAAGATSVLFIAHRSEILDQAMDSFRRVFPDKILGVLTGAKKEPDADILFASVQTLALKKNLQQFDPRHFDYIVVDEFHHASANTYRKVIAHFEPQFLIGLTATPDRMDGTSILELCHENLVYRAGLVRGIACKLLVPFRYFGVKDEVDFQQIPWRGRWPVAELTAHVATEGRADQTLREYRKHAPSGTKRTLAFCCSVAHADYMAQYFVDQGISAVAVHSESSSAPRAESLRQLRNGDLEILCAVDVFNEGLDVPDINVVLMLRPTESPVIFLQQLGRGLRRPDKSDKEHLTVVDFIGNHRSFLIKPQALVALTGQDLVAGAALEAIRHRTLELPDGCYVDIETEAIEMLERVGRFSKEDMLVYEYVTLRDGHGRRPTAAEVLAAGVHMKPVKDRYGNWFDFVRTQGDLEKAEKRVLDRHRAWFTDLMKTSMARSYKMVTLRAMLDQDVLREPVAIGELVQHAYDVLNEDLVLRQELREVRQKDDYLAALKEIWRKEPLRHWSAGKSDSQRWFELDRNHFRFRGEVASEDSELFDQMTAELVELRLAERRDKLRSKATGEVTPIRLRVSHANRRPILRLDRKHHPAIPPQGQDDLVSVDGQNYIFGFRKVAVNKVTRQDGGENELPRLMRKWFGPSAGHPGSRHYVLLTRHDGEWDLSQERDDDARASGQMIAFPALRYFDDLKVACGMFESQSTGQSHSRHIRVEANIDLDPERHFVVQAQGDSMNGGTTPIEDGDLVLCEWLSGTNAEAVEGTPCLVTGNEPPAATLAALKVPIRREGMWLLRSFNPSFADEPIPTGMTLLPVARFVQVVSELDGPALWGRYNRDEAAKLFGLKSNRSWQVGQRDVIVRGEGHSILFVKLRKGKDTPAEQRYADRFLSPSEFQWESQASTTPTSKRGRNIVEQGKNNQRIHLFCRYDDSEGFIYCGELKYRRHQGSKPIRIWFELARPLPDRLWRLWAI